MSVATDSDTKIYESARELFELHGGKPSWRLIGVKLSGFTHYRQKGFIGKAGRTNNGIYRDTPKKTPANQPPDLLPQTAN